MIVLDGKEAYDHFLASDWWKELSSEKRRQVGHCERCPATINLQSHHKFYRENWFDTQLDDLEVLCRGCHEKHHQIGDETAPAPLLFNSKKSLIDAFQNRQINRGQYLSLKRKLKRMGIWPAKKKKNRLKKKWKQPKPERPKDPKAKGWWPGMYEGKTAEEARRQVGTNSYSGIIERKQPTHSPAINSWKQTGKVYGPLRGMLK